jgi:hypothetical protein
LRRLPLRPVATSDGRPMERNKSHVIDF